jgi:NAD(P)-dependent dehydrogenase (short-subunit alcohol dehydrogenase family)
MALLDEKVAIVSGVGRGLGREVCLALLREGARVVAGDIDVESLGELGAAASERLVVQETDITDAAQCQRLADVALREHGRIDVLVNDAYHGGDFLTFQDADLDVWRDTADVNIWGTLRMTRAVVPTMVERGDGRVIMIVTQGVEWVNPGFGAYTGTKAAVAHYVKLLASELGPSGIRVNGVYPGPMWGPALEAHFAQLAESRGVSPDTVYEEWAADTALRHLVTPADVAGSVVFLASDLATWITGQALYVNAGQWFH